MPWKPPVDVWRWSCYACADESRDFDTRSETENDAMAHIKSMTHEPNDEPMVVICTTYIDYEYDAPVLPVAPVPTNVVDGVPLSAPDPSPFKPRAPYGTDRCGMCGFVFVLNRDGTITAHNIRFTSKLRVNGQYGGRCPGSHTLPVVKP